MRDAESYFRVLSARHAIIEVLPPGAQVEMIPCPNTVTSISRVLESPVRWHADYLLLLTYFLLAYLLACLLT